MSVQQVIFDITFDAQPFEWVLGTGTVNTGRRKPDVEALPGSHEDGDNKAALTLLPIRDNVRTDFRLFGITFLQPLLVGPM